jgi:hypothetical protein
VILSRAYARIWKAMLLYVGVVEGANTGWCCVKPAKKSREIRVRICFSGESRGRVEFYLFCRK